MPVITAPSYLGKRKPPPLRALQVTTYFDDQNIAKWLTFSDVWNNIIGELREIDLISNSEKGNLEFVHLNIDETVKVRSSPQGINP